MSSFHEVNHGEQEVGLVRGSEKNQRLGKGRVKNAENREDLAHLTKKIQMFSMVWIV